MSGFTSRFVTALMFTWGLMFHGTSVFGQEQATNEKLEPTNVMTTEPRNRQDLNLVDAHLESLEQRIRQLEQAEQTRKSLDQVQEGETDAKNLKEASNPKDTGWVDVSSEKWTVKLGGHVQADYINWAQASPSITGAQDYFEFRRLRLMADGTGYGIYDFRLQLTLEPESFGESPLGAATTPDVKDAYLTMNEVPFWGRIRFGNFFVPFSLEQVTNDTNNIFLERSIPTQGIFAVDREVGIASYQVSLDNRWTVSTGIFFDNISDTFKERIDDNQGLRVVGRWTWLPYYDEPSQGRFLTHLGLGVLHTQDQDDRLRIRARPQIREGPRLIDTGILGAENYTTGNLEAAIVWGRFTVQSETFLSTIDRGSSRAALNGTYLHFSYFVTGENRKYERFGQHGAQFGRNQPISNFFVVPGHVSPGAWELKGRWSHLDLSDLLAGQYNDFTFGCNWYWNDRTRWMLDWIHPLTSKDTPFGSTASDLLALRLDFNW